MKELTGIQGLTLMAIVGSTLLAGICFGVQLENRTAEGKRLGEKGRRSTSQRRKTSHVVLLAIGLFAAAFIVVMTVTYWVKGGVPDTLIQYTLGAGGVEALLLAGIKISKVRAGEREDTYE